ncbi:MAG: tetraacyldisaccharide 4'-kinase [Candidatus Omnitrophica bacterium]|nr:tetraacyldisaccharide 4'-kinase [Candidatus Omnitrophota bacterium]
MSSAQEFLYNLVTGKIKGAGGILLRGILLVLSWFYGLAVILLSGFYRIKPRRLAAKVISVGNITLGGTGKTVLVEYLAAKLSASGKTVAVLSRGYKRDISRSGLPGMGDEPAMLQEKLPRVKVVVDKDRVRGAGKAVGGYKADTLLLDDGMQQWRIFKDLEIVMIDAANPFGNRRMLPAGFLREPLCALRRADIFVLTKDYPGLSVDKLEADLGKFNPRALIVTARHAPVGFRRIGREEEFLDPGLLRGKRAAIFSGIGNPGGFRSCVEGLGISVESSFDFTDHHNYSLREIEHIMEEAGKRGLETVITTCKDAVKIRGLEIKDLKIMVLEVKLEIVRNETEFDRRLFKLYCF